MRYFTIRVAGLYIGISAKYDMVYRICAHYRTDSPWLDFSVSADDASIRTKIADFSVDLTPEMAECIVIHEKIALQLWKYNAFVLHSSLLYDGKHAFAVCAPRGVGKSTHAALWKQKYGNNIRLINGDKPIIRLGADGIFYAFGTPWCGKEGEEENTSVPLDAVCLLKRAENNHVTYPSETEYLQSLIGQVVFPATETAMNYGAKLLARFIRLVPAVTLHANTQIDSATLLHDTLYQNIH